MKDVSQKLRQSAAHARCWELLSWYANGTLQTDQVSLVEQHVSDCAECATELRVQRALQDQLRDGAAVVMAPQSAWQKMAERLDREEDELAQRFSGRPNKSSEVRATGVWRWAVAAQALIIVGLTAMWWQGRVANTEILQPRYQTLTSVTNASLGRGTVRVVFRRDLPVSEVNTLLQSLSVQIVAGPTEAGVFTLAANADTASQGGAQLLTQLRSDARVIFSEPLVVTQEHR